MSGLDVQTLARLGKLPLPQAEYRFCPKRRWRFDYAWPAEKVALEIEGGVWTKGRHTRGVGYVRDMEKYNAAAVAGWCVIRTTPGDVESGAVLETLEAALGRTR